MLKKILLVCIYLISTSTIYGNDIKKNYFGLFMGPSYIMNSTELQIFPGSNDCGFYSDGKSLSYSLGLFYTYQKYEDIVDFDFRIFYENRPVSLTAQSSSYEVLDPSSNQYKQLILLHKYEGDLSYISIDIGAKYQPLKHIPAFIRLGFEAGNPIVSTNFDNTEEIISPAGLLFPDETIRHSIDKGEITNAGTALSLSLGVSYKFKLENEMFIEPSLTYRKSINSVIGNQQWNQDIIRLIISVGLEEDFKKEAPLRMQNEIEVMPIVDEIKSEAPIVLEYKATPITLLQTVVTQTYPILPYLFYDSGQSGIKSHYLRTNTSNFDEAQLPNDNLSIYYNVLNILGSRLTKYPNTKIIINGTQDGNETLSDPEFSLAYKRAEELSDYLLKNWKIEKKRIATGFIKKPTLPTSESYPEGLEENRRVEITSDNFALIEPVIQSKFFEYRTLTNKIINSFTSNIPYNSWKASFKLNRKTIKEFEGTGRFNESFDLNDIINKISLNPKDEISVQITAVYPNGDVKSINQDIKIETDRSLFETGRLNLIVFDFDKSELTDFNKSIIENFVKNEVKQKSILRITGTTDKLGDSEYNLKLSQERADNVSKFLKSIIPDVKINEVKGLGYRGEVINNSLPEGRFYSRTVLIEVETPVD